MGAGDFSAGVGMAGLDPVFSTKRKTRRLDVATFFDLSVRDAVLLEDGRITAAHPVDQQVQMSFAIERGTLRSAPEIGHTLRQLRRGNRQQVTQDFIARVLDAQPYAQLILEQKIEHLGVELTVPASGAVFGFIKYRNLRRSPSDVTTQPINL